ncbi:MAG: hypothetical protein IPP15_23370 [Saprospiraceae bacterium]|uniref:Uncharacterized protein n=1 Tax=Candidatus Opimibacter skivensis TaxID=2982028 RepID=A0A9D7SY39_9BACT|nr:hypothetical protein [Candidatus Opimibacter skivensis]
MKSIDATCDMKLRVGWGANGNQEGIPNYARYGLVVLLQTCSYQPTFRPPSEGTYGNPDLNWKLLHNPTSVLTLCFVRDDSISQLMRTIKTNMCC